MKLIPNWRTVLRRAWSLRLLAVAGLLSGAEAALPLVEGYLPIPPGVFAALTGLTVAAAFASRLIAQKGVTNAEEQDRSD